MMQHFKRNHIHVFVDGACKGNPGPGGWGVVLILPDVYVKETGGHEKTTTNNQMELTAAIEALKALQHRTEPITIYTDSKYVINGITDWVHKWRKNGWKNFNKKEVANRKIWEKLLTLTELYPSSIDWKYVPGHSGHDGNERADEIAVCFSKGKKPDLFKGKFESYRFTYG